MSVSVEIQGIPEAIAAFVRYGDSVHRDLKDVTMGAANDTATLAKRKCPVDTGRLRASIRVRPSADPGVGGLGIGAEVYTDVVYAARIEFGFVGFDSLGRYYSPDNDFNANGEPFMGPAWETIRPLYLDSVVAALRSAGYGAAAADRILALADPITGSIVG
jgi:hypothetical protein